MTRKERTEVEIWASTLTNEELERQYYDLAYDSSLWQSEQMLEAGYDLADILERKKFEKFMSEKCDLLGYLCEQRGIKLWDHITLNSAK